MRTSVLVFLVQGSALAQMYVSGLGGVAALSGAAAAQSSPPATSSYDAKVGAAFNMEAGYHFNDWISVQAGYIWNRNQIVTTEFNGVALVQRSSRQSQHAVGGEMLLYFRPRSSWVRPYLSAGPAWVRMMSANERGLRVAVGADLIHQKSGWGFRYSFSEMITPNAFGAALRPSSGVPLMNFQNLFGVVKRF